MFRQQLDVFRPPAQRGNPQLKDIQPVQQVRPESSVGDERLQVLIACSNHTNVGCDLLRGADRAIAEILQKSQERHLRLRRERIGLVEEQRPTARLRNDARPRLPRIGERAFAMTEQLRLDQAVRHGAAIDRDERSRCPRTRAMDRTCRQFLARSGFTLNEDDCLTARHLLDLPDDGADLRRLADQHQ